MNQKYNKTLGRVLLMLLLLLGMILTPNNHSNMTNHDQRSTKARTNFLVYEKNVISPFSQSKSNLGLDTIYATHTPISIDGNLDFQTQAASEGWDLGGSQDGTKDKPYVIEGYNITDSAANLLIQIQNTDYYFVLTNNFLNASGGPAQRKCIEFDYVSHGSIIQNNITQSNSGIWLTSSSNNTISNNYIYNNNYGIIFSSASNNNSISSNVLNNNAEIGIYAQTTCTYNIYNDNVVNNSNYGIQMYSASDYNTFSKNNVSNSGYSGIEIDYSSRNTINDNIIQHTTYYGIRIGYASSTNNTIYGNNISDSYTGISVISASNNTILSNTVSITSYIGIESQLNSNNIIKSNNISNTASYGISLINSVNITIEDNILSTVNSGIVLGHSNNTIISGNSVSTSSYYGIYLGFSLISRISSNYLYKGQYGIFYYASSDSLVNNNYLLNNTNEGIYIGYSTNNTDIGGNSIINSTNYGVYIDPTPSLNNVVSWNNFIDNGGSTSQAYDYGGHSNIFDHNFYNDHTSPDAGNDKIVDVVYDIDHGAGGTNYDQTPLTMQYSLTSPSIISPVQGSYDSSVTISWSNSTDNYNNTIFYSSYYSSDNGFSWLRLPSNSQANNSLWDILTLQNGTIYLLKIISKTSQGLISSTISNPITIVHYLPNAPSNLLVTKQTGMIQLSWQELNYQGSSQITFMIFKGTTPSSYQFLDNTTNLVYTDNSVSLGTTYYYKVTACNQIGEASSETSIFYATTPDAPQNVVVSVFDGINILSWSGPASDGGSVVTGYKIFRGTISGTYDIEFNTSNTYYNDSSIDDLTLTYYYAIEAVNSEGNGIQSTEVMIHDNTNPTVAITNLSEGVNTNISGVFTLIVNAQDQNGIWNVTIYIKGGSYGNNDQILKTSTSFPYNYALNTTSLENGEYTITVVAYDNAGNHASGIYYVTVDNESQNANQSSNNTNNESNTGNDNTPIIIAAGAGVIVLGGATLSIRSRRRKKGNSNKIKKTKGKS